MSNNQITLLLPDKVKLAGEDRNFYKIIINDSLFIEVKHYKIGFLEEIYEDSVTLYYRNIGDSLSAIITKKWNNFNYRNDQTTKEEFIMDLAYRYSSGNFTARKIN